MDKNGRLQKRYRKGKSGLDAHLDDYAFFVWGLLELYEATFKIEYLKNAIQLSDIMVSEFWNESSGGFYLGSDQTEKLIVRAMTGYDGAIPSGNSIAAMNLLSGGSLLKGVAQAGNSAPVIRAQVGNGILTIKRHINPGCLEKQRMPHSADPLKGIKALDLRGT